LREADEPIELTTLAEQVAAWENDTDIDEITEQQRKRVYVSLYQTHIPRLDEAGVIEYDSETGSVALTDDATAIDGYLDSPDDSFPWPTVYLFLAGASILLFALSSPQVGPVLDISETVIVAGIVIAFVVTATVHTLTELRNSRTIPSEFRKRL
jgi:hypothetical protein